MIVLMFPGQSSRYPEMLAKFTGSPILEEVNDLLGRDLAATLDLSTNRDVQLGVFVANELHRARLDLSTTCSLGLSLGEYNHLVHIGALKLADAIRLVAARGRLYDEAQGGAMVSVFPLEAAPIEAAISRLGLGDRAGIGLYNSPRQHVISGERAAVEQIVAALEDEGYFAATEIEPRIPMHSPWFAPTAKRFAEILDTVEFQPPHVAYVPNTLGRIATDTSPAAIRARLVEHVHRPVRWRESIDAIAAEVSDPLFLECGPKAVLHNLFGKDWMPGRRAKTDAAEGFVDLQELHRAA